VVLSGVVRPGQAKGADGAMRNIVVFSAAAVLVGYLLTADNARAGGEKVDIGKLPKAVVDTLTAKFPKGMLKRATVEKVDGKVIYEVVVNLTKETHIHAVVEANGKLLEIHRHIEPKELPDKVAKAVAAKYPKAKIEEAEEQANADGKIIAYEVVVELNATTSVIILLDPDGKIQKETKETIKKDSK
jgi:hypothetical protein